jgi:hypothetical protein
MSINKIVGNKSGENNPYYTRLHYFYIEIEKLVCHELKSKL